MDSKDNKKKQNKNDAIRDKFGVDSITTRIEKQQLEWFGHLNRMCKSKTVKRMWEARNKKVNERPKETCNA